jgi:hypothetical protein
MLKHLSITTLLLGGSLIAQELSGRWKGGFKAEGGDHAIPQLIILKRNGNQLTGSGGPDDSEQYPIANGAVNGDKIHFELTTARSKFFYDLKKTESDLNGQLKIKSIDRVNNATVSLKKEK